MSSFTKWLAASACAGLLLVLVVTACCCLCVRKHRRRQEKRRRRSGKFDDVVDCDDDFEPQGWYQANIDKSTMVKVTSRSVEAHSEKCPTAPVIITALQGADLCLEGDDEDGLGDFFLGSSYRDRGDHMMLGGRGGGHRDQEEMMYRSHDQLSDDDVMTYDEEDEEDEGEGIDEVFASNHLLRGGSSSEQVRHYCV